jgi:tetratricopeptide (TPR) repeat protein
MLEEFLEKYRPSDELQEFSQANAQAYLARCYIQLGRLREADSLIALSHQTFSQIDLEHDLDHIPFEFGGMAYMSRGDYDRAEVCFRRAIGIREATRDPTTPWDADDASPQDDKLTELLWWLRNCFYEQRELDSAMETGKKLLWTTQRNYGFTDTLSLKYADELAALYVQCGRAQEAAAVCRSTLAAIHADPDSPPKIRAEWELKLAWVSHRLGKSDDANRLLFESAEEWEEGDLLSDWEGWWPVLDGACARMEEGRLAEASDTLRELLELQAGKVGRVADRRRGSIIMYLAECTNRLGDVWEADSLFRLADGLIARDTVTADWRVVFLAMFSEFLYRHQMYEASEAPFRELIRLLPELPQFGNKHVASYMTRLADALFFQRKLPQAIDVLEEKLGLIQKRAADNFDVLETIGFLAWCHELAGSVDVAESLLVVALQRVQGADRPDPKLMTRFYAQLSELQQMEGRYEDAIASEKAAISVVKREFGEQDMRLVDHYWFLANTYMLMDSLETAEYWENLADSVIRLNN